MKRILFCVVAAMALIQVQSVKAGNDSFNPYASLVATDIWTVNHDRSYDINFELGNTTGNTLAGYEVTFIPSFLSKDSISVTNAIVTELLPSKKCNLRLSVALKTAADTITGYLASVKGDTISDPFLLFKDTDPIIETDAGTALCVFTARDEENSCILYYFSIYANNARPYDITDFSISLNTATDNGKTSQMDIPFSLLKKGERRYLATVLAFDIEATKASLWLTDERGVQLTDTMRLKLTDKKFKFVAPSLGQDLIGTMLVLDENYIPQDYEGDSLRAGQIMFTMPFYSGTPSDVFIWPDTAYGYLSFKDLYGNTYLDMDLNAGSFVEDCDWAAESYEVMTSVITLLRGGEYEYSRYLDFIGLDKKDTLCVYDYPTVRYDMNRPKIGDPISISIAANTGYPYADSLKTCTSVLDYDLIYVKPVNGKAEGDTIEGWRTGRQTLEFNLDRYPTLAGIDTVNIHLSDPEIGDYWLLAESDFMHHKKMTHVQVADTVRMKVELQSDKFRKGIDTLATVKYYIDYRWPFVLPENGDSIPSVRFKATCYKDSLDLSSVDSLLCDSLRKLMNKVDSLRADSIITANTLREYFVNDSLIIYTEPNEFLHQEGEFQFNIAHLPLNVENSVDFVLRFNGMEQKKMSLGLTLTEVKLEVEDVENEMDDVIYDLKGRIIQEVPQRGYFIRRGKTYIIW